jgi:hypothetical protein
MPSYAQRRQKIKEFKDVAGNVSDDTARKILESNAWNAEQALDHFFNNRASYEQPKEGNKAKLEKLFTAYADDDDPSLMSEDGMMKFFKDIGVNPEGKETLAIAWHLQASEMGLCQKSEFVEGFARSGCTTIADIKTCVQGVVRSLNQTPQFKQFYKWLFGHCKEDEKKKTIPAELAIQLWRIVLGDKMKEYPLLEPWLLFVQKNAQEELQAISKDIWEQLLDFLAEVQKPSDYDESAAWPVAIDEFMEEHKHSQ